jgi:tRNA pseudouridine55 synthase
MDGLLVIDKPVGPTSHDVVARARHILGERRIGHTGTLDPLASGVLPLVIGRATRLARFLSASDKTYEAEVTLGIATDSGDREGRPVGSAWAGPLPDRDRIEHALDAFRGTFLQRPPALSAKKIGGVRSYKLARGHRSARASQGEPGRGSAQSDGGPGSPAPVAVTVSALDLVSCAGATLLIRLTCSAGFYVRSLARDLGEALGTGAHLTALRRTASGDLTIRDAVPLADIEEPASGRTRALAGIVPLSGMLTALPGANLTPDGVRRAAHGRELGPDAFSPAVMTAGALVRLLDPGGNLVGLAEPAATAGLLHPAVVLV